MKYRNERHARLEAAQMSIGRQGVLLILRDLARHGGVDVPRPSRFRIVSREKLLEGLIPDWAEKSG